MPYIQQKSAQNIKNIAQKGANILLIGKIPEIQPSYLDYLQNDKLTHRLMSEVSKAETTIHISNLSEMNKWSVTSPIVYASKNENVRQQRRKLNDNTYAQFIWNESPDWSKLEITSNLKLPYAYWMNAEKGNIWLAEKTNNKYIINLAPYSSIFFLLSDKPQQENTDNTISMFEPSAAQEITQLSKWNIQTDTLSIQNSNLFDWKNSDSLKYNSKPVTYTTTFNITRLNDKKQYFLDLGKVHYAVDIKINNTQPFSQVFYPFISNISSYLKSGENTIELTVTTAAYNDFVGQAEKGEKVFRKLKGNETMSSGLIGPVKIFEQ